MKTTDRYKTAIRSFGEDGCSSKEAVERTHELYPEWCIEKQEASVRDNQIRAEIGSIFVSSQRDVANFRCDKSVKPARIYYIGDPIDEEDEEVVEITTEIEEATFVRKQVISNAVELMSVENNNRVDLFIGIRDMFNKAGLKVEVDHADSLKNGREAAHHPDNMQFLTSSDNGRKSSNSCTRFTYDEQSEYLMNEVKTLQRINVSINEHMVVMVLEMLKTVW